MLLFNEDGSDDSARRSQAPELECTVTGVASVSSIAGQSLRAQPIFAAPVAPGINEKMRKAHECDRAGAFNQNKTF